MSYVKSPPSPDAKEINYSEQHLHGHLTTTYHRIADHFLRDIFHDEIFKRKNRKCDRPNKIG